MPDMHNSACILIEHLL